jgi:hypothetical protein
MKIGDKIWIFDEHHRIYVDDDGVKHSSPIYRKKFVEYNIIDETKISWLISHYTYDNIPDWAKKNAKKVKKSEVNKIYWTSEEEIEKHCWIKENSYRLSELVKRCIDYDTLRRIEEIITE